MNESPLAQPRCPLCRSLLQNIRPSAGKNPAWLGYCPDHGTQVATWPAPAEQEVDSDDPPPV